MKGTLEEFVDTENLRATVEHYAMLLERLQRKRGDDYDQKVFSLSLAEILDSVNNDVVDGEFQKLRFDLYKSVLHQLKIPGLVSGFAGFDLVMQYDRFNEMFILVDRWSDLDDELIAMLYAKCSAYIGRNPADRCAVVELFGDSGVNEGWTGGDAEVDSKLSLISRDRLFCRVAGRDISQLLDDFIASCVQTGKR
ncbi:MAG: hypothetical protein IJ523_06340 [Succinivibrionaceae bacterium]|nr:hypothetical protein [Succinivibrionaceae bacterium]